MARTQPEPLLDSLPIPLGAGCVLMFSLYNHRTVYSVGGEVRSVYRATAERINEEMDNRGWPTVESCKGPLPNTATACGVLG